MNAQFLRTRRTGAHIENGSLGKVMPHSCPMKMPGANAPRPSDPTRPKIGRRWCAYAAGLLLSAAGLQWPAEAKAAGMAPLCDNSCAAIILLAMGGTAFIASVDVYYTVKAYGEVTPQSGRNAIYWTSWQAGLLDTIAFGGLTSGRLNESDGSMGVLALGTWPLSLTANGMWHAFPDNRSARGFAVGMVTFSDAVLLSYDALLLGYRRRPGSGLAAAEMLIGTLQLGFGLMTASQADTQDQALAWSMTAIPAAMATHGFLALALPEGKGSEQSRVQPPGAFAALPRLGMSPVKGGLMMQATGTF